MWDKSFDNITSDLVVTAQYEAITEPTIIVNNLTAGAGETVQVLLTVHNNPGVAGARLRISFDSELTLVSASNGDAFAELTYINPGKFTSPCNFNWDSESGMATEDGTILILTFEISDNVASGENLNIFCTYTSGDIYDEGLNDVDFDIISGAITVG